MFQNLIWFTVLLVSGQPQQLYKFDHYNNLPRNQHVEQNSGQQWPVQVVQYVQDDHMTPESDKNKLYQSRRFQSNTLYELPHRRPPQPTPRRNMNAEMINSNAGISQSPKLDMIHLSLANNNNFIPKSISDYVTPTNSGRKSTLEKKENMSVQNSDKKGLNNPLVTSQNDGVLLNKDVKCLPNDSEEKSGSTRRFISDNDSLVTHKENNVFINDKEHSMNHNNENNNLIEHIIVKEHTFHVGNGWNEGIKKDNTPPNYAARNGVENEKKLAELGFQENKNNTADLVNKDIDSRKYNKNVPELQKRITKIENQLIEPAKVYEISSSLDASVILLEHTRVCYACSSISDSSCWFPDRRTTVKYCRKGHDSCVTKTYKSREGNFIVIRDCSSTCDVILSALQLNYKSCSICHVDLCNDNNIDRNSAYTNNIRNFKFIFIAIIFNSIMNCK